MDIYWLCLVSEFLLYIGKLNIVLLVNVKPVKQHYQGHSQCGLLDELHSQQCWKISLLPAVLIGHLKLRGTPSAKLIDCLL